MDFNCARVPNRGKCICGEWPGNSIIHGTSEYGRKSNNGLHGDFKSCGRNSNGYKFIPNGYGFDQWDILYLYRGGYKCGG